MDWQTVRQEDLLRSVVKGGTLDDLLRRVRIQQAQLTRIVVFETGFGEGAGGGVLIEGTFDPVTVGSRLKDQGWEERRLRNGTAQCNSTSDDCVTFLGPGICVCGQATVLELVLDVVTHSQMGLLEDRSGPARRIADALGNNHPIVVIMVPPQGAHDAAQVAIQVSAGLLGLTRLKPLGDALGAVGAARAFGYSLDANNGRIPVRLVVQFVSQSAAVAVSGTLNLILGVGRLLPEPSDPAVRQQVRAAQQLRVTRDRDIVSVDMIMTAGDLGR